MSINTTQNATTENQWPYVTLDPKQGLILFLITLPGTVANIIAFLATLKLTRQQKNAAPNYLILALTFTDFYGITFCTLPTLICYRYKRWIGGNAMCNFQSVSTMFASLASGILATVMSTDRLIAIWKPFVYKKYVNFRKTLITITVTWLSAFAIAILPLAGQGFFVRNLTGTYCTINWFAKQTANQIYAVFYAILGVSLVSIVVFCNAKIVHSLLTSKAKQGNLHGMGSNDETRGKFEIQLFKSVGSISVLFVLCWFPFMIRIICNLTGTWINAWIDVQVARLLLLNFVLDPFLYTLSRKQCRDIVKEWFCCCCYRNGRRINLCPNWFTVMRTKQGSFLSSSGHIATSTTTSNVQLVHIKRGSTDTTPEHSVTDVVVHTNNHRIESQDREENSGRHLTVTEDENSDGCEIKPMHRMHSEIHARKPKYLEEKTISMPDLAHKLTTVEDEEVKVDVGFMYDLAFQRQNSN